MENSDSPNAPASLDVYTVIMIMADQMAQIAWAKLGLQPDPVSGKLALDLVQAKESIDLVAHLSNLIDAKLDEQDRRRIQGTVRDLRLNFVEKSKESGT